MSEMKKLGRTWRLRIKTVTPLHIGTGTILLRDYDYRTANKETFVLNQDAILTREYERTNIVPIKPAGLYTTERDLVSGSGLVRYTLSGETSLDQIHEQIKDVRGNLYIPGSTFKGAWRSVLLARMAANGALAGTSYKRGSPKTAAQPFEQAAFRPKNDDAKFDLLRALQVADSEPVPVERKTLLLQHVRVIADDADSIPVAVEAIPRLVTFVSSLRLDDYLLDEHRAELGWGSAADLMGQLPALANDWADRQIERDQKLAKQKGWAEAEKAYAAMLKRPKTPGVFLMQLGWGTGWESKTVGTYLPEEQMRAACIEFELGKPPQWKGAWRPDFDKPFPKGHRLTVKGSGNNAPAQEPLGWVLVELKAS